MQESKTRIGAPRQKPAEILNGEALSTLIHKIGHEIGNPLTAIISLATIIERFSRESPTADLESTFKKSSGYAASIIDEAWKIGALSERLVMLLSTKPGNVGQCNLSETLNKATQKLRVRTRLARANVLVSTLSEGPFLALIDSEQLGLLLSELLINAQNVLNYEYPGNEADHPITALLRFDNDRVILSITNDLPDASAGDLSDRFELFHTLYPNHKHLGLGLTMCAAIADRFGGSLRIIEQPRQTGYSFTTELSLPTAVAEAHVTARS